MNVSNASIARLEHEVSLLQLRLLQKVELLEKSREFHNLVTEQNFVLSGDKPKRVGSYRGRPSGSMTQSWVGTYKRLLALYGGEPFSLETIKRDIWEVQKRNPHRSEILRVVKKHVEFGYVELINSEDTLVRLCPKFVLEYC